MILVAKDHPTPREQKVTFQVEEITPEMAASWLEHNVSNRRVQWNFVNSLARDIVAGRFLMTGDPIRFDWDGNMFDSQHRLWACVQADMPIVALVGRGFDPAVKFVIDSGRIRRLADVFHIHDEVDSALLGAIVNVCVRFDRDRWSGVYNPTRTEAIEWLTDNPDVRQATRIANVGHRHVGFAPSSIGASYYLNSRIDPVAADSFWQTTTTGEELKAGDPQLALRRWATTILARRDKPTGRVQFAYCMKEMNAFREGRQIRILHWKSEEGMPTAWQK